VARRVSTIVSTARGTLIRKTRRQSIAVSAPPRTGPSAAIAQAMAWEAPIAVVARAKITVPARRTRRIPNRSPNLPPKTISAASGRMLAVISHCDWESRACRPTIACGVASGTAVWSTRIIELASVIAAGVIFMLRREVIAAPGLPGQLVGDLGQPRGGFVAL
jgi:hypothetical protein